MPYSVIYHPDIKKRDIPAIDGNLQQRLRKAIETRLMVAPQDYGEPLRKTLKGYWKLRVGDYRIVFWIDGKDILILGICDRKAVYPLMQSRQRKPG
jgi:mRNA interferase RelE/StbE